MDPRKKSPRKTTVQKLSFSGKQQHDKVPNINTNINCLCSITQMLQKKHVVLPTPINHTACRLLSTLHRPLVNTLLKEKGAE